MFSSYDISTSGLMAQRARLDAIASNLANVSTTRGEDGAGPYRPRYVTFAADASKTTSAGGIGVRVSGVQTSTAEPIMRYAPNHPDSDSRGYVAMPNVNMTTEFVDALEATRAYEANIGVMEITADLGERTLQILA
ncbi:flagellar basal body rod protein FlgC [Botrimarina sp.]|uniref:flagellar basal body rod protein FlgC n=1 Tax=Botrimarina sp. TaxID=2795802 RepID=UPI0032F09BB7